MIGKGFFHVPETPDDQPYLIGSKCRECGYACFPKKRVCVRCLRDDTMEQIRMGRKAVLDAFALMRVGPPDMEVPYMIGYVRTVEGALIFTPITGCETEDDALTIGEEMELVIDRIKQDGHGNSLIGWSYRPVRRKPQ